MAAYAALVSLMQIFHQIQHHPFPPISMDKKQVESLTDIVMFLQEFLEGYKSPFADSDEADPLEMRIADTVYAAEDVIESHIVDQLRPAASASAGSSTSADLYESLVKVIEDIYLIKKQVMEIVAAKDQLQKQVLPSASSSTSSKASLSILNSTAMVGFDDVMLQLMDKLTDGRLGRRVIPIVGMGGIGKTTLAMNVYEKPLITHHFDICAWVTISQQYNTKELLSEILSQANKQKQGLSETRGEDVIGLALYKYLSCRRYLVVLDDVWSIKAWDKIRRYFPDDNNGSRIMVTTRLSNLGSKLDKYGLEMKFLDEESSWDMFCKTVFKGKSCPSELEKIGKKIVESCRGLPLSIVVMGGLLEKLEPTKEYWESIRRSINSLVNLEDDMHCLKMLKLSYNHLPVYLKPCFLYLGMFEEDRSIRVSTVIKLWVSEGFLKPIGGKSLEAIAKEYLDELVDRNLILVHKLGKTGNMKYCKIHDLLRDLCIREARKERFYDVVGQHSPQGTGSQRRLAILGSTLEEKVDDAKKYRPYARSCISDRSCWSDRERVQLLPNLRLLMTMTACDEGFYPGGDGDGYYLGKLLELVNLRLLVVYSEPNCAQLPSSINLLWNLQTLIVSYFKSEVVAPVEIWSMPQLRHVNFWYRPLHLPDPPRDKIVIMENLQTLKKVRNFKCDEMMVCRIPNIKKLGLMYYDDEGIEPHDDDFCVHNIERLQKLESLSCYCFPRGGFSQKITFPYSLKSLDLTIRNGCMEDMLERVSTLPHLQKLKMSDGEFTTGKWETVEGQFLSLKFLLLSCHHLESWMIESSHFPCLEHIHLSALQDLEEIPVELGEISTLKYVRLTECSESVVRSAKKMVEEQEDLQGGDELSFKVSVNPWFPWKKNDTLQSLAKKKELESLANSNFEVW